MNAFRFILFFFLGLIGSVPVAVNAMAPQAAEFLGWAARFSALGWLGMSGEGEGLVGLLFSPKADPEQAARIHHLAGQAWGAVFKYSDWHFYLAIILAVAVAASIAGLLVKAMAARDRFREKGPQK